MLNIKKLFTKVLTAIKSTNDTIGTTDISAIGDGSITGAIDELNSKVTENTEWVVLGNHIKYKKYRGIVWVKIFSGNNEELNKSGVSLGTLPVGFRPNIELDFGATSLGGSEVVFFRVNAAGNVTGYSNTATKYWTGTMAYPAA